MLIRCFYTPNVTGCIINSWHHSLLFLYINNKILMGMNYDKEILNLHSNSHAAKIEKKLENYKE